MKLTKDQAKALKVLGDAYANLAYVYPGLESVLDGHPLLPSCDLQEAAHQLWYASESGEWIE